MPRAVLENYLNRSITFDMAWFFRPGESAQSKEVLRFIQQAHPKFIGRSAYIWSGAGVPDSHGETGVDRIMAAARLMSDQVHAIDPDIILQAAIFENVTPDIDNIPIPAWVFQAFGLDVEVRHFRYQAMLFPRTTNPSKKDFNAPDITRLETRLFFYYLARRYIDAGMEALHMGQVGVMGKDDVGYADYFDLVARIRRYAKSAARRRWVLCDAHTHGIVDRAGNLLFDFHSSPSRISGVGETLQRAVFDREFPGAIYGHSRGGINPSGWPCASNPYLVELDNYGGQNAHVGVSVPFWPWGYDEIAWFAHQPHDYRARWLAYAVKWVRDNDANGHFEMPGRRTIKSAAIGRVVDYNCLRPSPAFPDAFGDEDAIKAAWGTLP